MVQRGDLRGLKSDGEALALQMVISGVGGQGVLLMTRIFADLAVRAGLPLIGSEDHGMSQRGGSVLTHLKIGPFSSPLVKKGGADLLLSLEKNEALKTLPFLRPGADGRPGGLGFINVPGRGDLPPPILTCLEEQGIEVRPFGADQVAREMGSIQSANVALLGFASAHPRFPFPPEEVRRTLERTTPPRFLEVSLRIFDRSLQEGRRAV
jgi:indolepyruvate ferredoxin oxidoreductase, beta subunit